MGRDVVERRLPRSRNAALARILTFDFEGFAFIFGGWRKPVPSGLPYHRNNSILALVFLVAFAAIPELIVVDAVVHLYAVFWFVALYASFRNRPHVIENGALLVRRGLFDSLTVPLESIELVEAAVRPTRAERRSLRGHTANLSILDAKLVGLRLRTPLAYRSLFGASHSVGYILIAADEPNVAIEYPERDRSTFGILSDASPDRWGRALIARRFERDKRAGLIAATDRLSEKTYLLGVHDAFRSGGLRFKNALDGPFLDARDGDAAPPFVRLRALEAASRTIERNDESDDTAIDAALHLLLAPGGSLGGARPKASVVDLQGNLWIAKFPSVRDEGDVEAWEAVLHDLAAACGLNVPQSDVVRFGNTGATFSVRRFDRTETGARIHFASALTLTNRTDGDDADTGASYLELARVLIERGSRPDRDLEELWSRIVFSMLVSNTADHLRNHGFLLEPAHGWQLSPLFDVNPVADAYGLRLNVDEIDNARDLDLARSVARYFRIRDARAHEIVERFRTVVATWSTRATERGIARAEQRAMSSAFSLAS